MWQPGSCTPPATVVPLGGGSPQQHVHSPHAPGCPPPLSLSSCFPQHLSCFPQHLSCSQQDCLQHRVPKEQCHLPKHDLPLHPQLWAHVDPQGGCTQCQALGRMLCVPAHITPSSECTRPCRLLPWNIIRRSRPLARTALQCYSLPHTHLRPVFVTCSLLQSSPPVSPSPSPPPASPPPPPAVGPNIPALKSCSQGLAIPSYFYPGIFWAQAKAAKANIMIINPASGPGAAVDANYVATVTDMKAAGGGGGGSVHSAQSCTAHGQDDSVWKHCCVSRVLHSLHGLCACMHAWHDGDAVAAGMQAPPCSGMCTPSTGTEIRRWSGKTSTSECAWGRTLQK